MTIDERSESRGRGETPERGARRLQIGRVPIDRITMGGALDAIEALIAAGRGGVVVTPNVDHVVIADRHPAFREAYAAANLSLADGQPIVWASHLLGKSVPEKVSGSDLVLPLLDRAARRGWRVYLLGGAPGVAEAAADRLTRERGVEIAGTAAPRLRPADATARPDPAAQQAADAVRAARPDLVLVALGAPKQEVWMHRYRDALAPAVLVGVGASLDFVAGRVRRAPRWVSSAGLEWLWRLSREPRRLWKRYLIDDAQFIPILVRTLRKRRATRER
jgi:N-acetylglucosaminyldiphosphoundecaprenol N-acetyl-beta-D-mannosaminyltransferase